MNQGFAQQKKNICTSCGLLSSEQNEAVNYFNANFREDSDTSYNTKVTSVPTKDYAPFELEARGRDILIQNKIKPILKPISMLLEKSEMSDPPIKEKTLSEIGFNSTEISNWDQIAQLHKPDLLVLLDRMIKNYIKTNVRVIINDTTFHCHMMVLQCYSDFFMKLNNEELVVLPADMVTPQAFIMIYDWMLSSKPMVQREGILELFNAAQYLKIKGLVDQCWVCLDDEKRFCEDAAFLLYLEARKYDHELTKQLMLTRIYKFFLTLVASKEFLELTPKEICTLLQSNSIGVNSETEVLMSGVRWLNFDWEQRQKYMLDIMQCVRFGLMTPWQLVELRRNTDSPEIQKIVSSPEIQKMIDDGLSYVTTKYWYANHTENLFHFMERLNLSDPEERQWIRDKTWAEQFECPNQLYSSYNSFLQYLEMIRNIGKEHWKSLECHEGSPNLNKLLTQTNKATQVRRNLKKKSKSLPIKIIHLSASEKLIPKNYHLSNEGDSKSENYKLVHLNSKYATASDKTKIVRLKKENKNESCKKFYRLATKTDNEKADATRIDSESNTGKWFKPKEYLQTLIEKTYFGSLSPNKKLTEAKDKKFDFFNKIDRIQNYKMLIFGGIDPYNQEATEEKGKEVLQYNFSKNKWDIVTTMPGARHHHSAVSFKGKIYIIGGTRPANNDLKMGLTKSVWSFDPEKLQWEDERCVQSSRRDFGLVASNDGLYLIGGENNARCVVSSTLYYDVENKTWKKKGALITPRAGLMCLWTGKKILAAGGVVNTKNANNITNTVEIYDPKTDCWTEYVSLRMPRCFGKICIVNKSEIYILGGVAFNIEDKTYQSLQSIDKYYVDLKEWREVGSLQIARHGHDITCIEDKIFIIGGVSTFQAAAINAAECFCTKDLTTVNGFAPLPKPLSGLAAIVIN